MIKLSDRLEKICSYIAPGETVADIGSDHGSLPLALFERDISPYLILTDNKPGPLEKLRDNIDRYFQRSESVGRYVVIEQADDTVCFDIRMGNGLEVLDYAEVDTAVIAGMGGLLIIELLRKNQAKTRSIKKLILQPRIGGDKLREWLVENGYPIMRDELAMEAGRINEIITVGVCESAAPCAAIQINKNSDNVNQSILSCVELLRETGLIYEIGEGLLWRRDPLLPEFLRRHIERNNKIIAEISRSGSGDSTAKRLAELIIIRDTYAAIMEKISAFM